MTLQLPSMVSNTARISTEMLRTFRTFTFPAIAVAVLHCPCVALAQTYPSFREVDFVYAQDPQRFQALWETARLQTVRVAVIGDSQETNPTSHGLQYMPLLNYEMWKRFGNSPETPLASCLPTGPSPAVKWLTAAKCATLGPVATRLTASQILPNVRPGAYSTLNSTTNVTGGSYGQLTMLEQDAAHVHSSAGIPTNRSYFDTSGVVKARIFAATNASSGELAYQARPNTVASASYSAPITTTGSLSLGLQSPTYAVKSGDTSALDFNGNRYLALEVFGTSDTQLTDVIGMRYFNETRPEGVVMDSFALGGYSASSFVRQHANAGAMFSAFGFHGAIIHYGANEAGSVSAEQFKLDISALISRVRAWVSDSSFPIILVADVYQSRPSPAQLLVYDQYVGAQLAIAQADSNVMVINARRLMEDIGWNASNNQATQYLEDGIHYTPLGAQVLSSAVVSAMMGEIRVSGCMSDPGTVALQASMTVVFDVGGTTACTNHSQLNVARALTLNQPSLKIQLRDGYTPAAGDEFKLFSFATISGSLGTITLPTLPSGLSWDSNELAVRGTIKVVTPAVTPPPPPPLPPAPPTINIISGSTQSITLPASPGPLAFSITGSAPLSVTASSSDTNLLPNAGITISAGCGTSTLSCTATMSAIDARTGVTSLSLTVVDALGRSDVTTTTLEVKPATVPDTGSGTAPGNGNAGNTSNRRSGGGGSFELISLLGFIACLLLSASRRRARTAIISGRRAGAIQDEC